MLALRFDHSQWVAAGSPGYDFRPWPDGRRALPEDLFGGTLTADAVAAAVQVVPKAITDWARRSVTLIESWRWAAESPAGRRAHQQALAADLARLTWWSALSAVSRAEGQGDPPSALETLQRERMDDPLRWINHPADVPAGFLDRALLRRIPATVCDGSPMVAAPLVTETGDRSVGFAIVRHPLGKGRGRGWLFQRAKLLRIGTGTLPAWLSDEPEA